MTFVRACALELAAEIAHVQLHLVARSREGITPDELEHLVVREQLTRVAHEGCQEAKFERGERDLGAVHRGAALGEVDAQKRVRVGPLGLLPRPCATEHRLDTRQ